MGTAIDYLYQGQYRNISEICRLAGVSNYAFRQLVDGAKPNSDISNVVTAERWKQRKSKADLYLYRGELLSANQIALATDLSISTVSGRIRKAKASPRDDVTSLIDAIQKRDMTAEDDERAKQYEFMGDQMTLRSLAERFNRNLNSLRSATFVRIEDIRDGNIFDSICFQTKPLANGVQVCGWRTKEALVLLQDQVVTRKQAAKKLGVSVSYAGRVLKQVH